MSIDEMEISGETLWFLGYDLESENSKNLKPRQKDWLRDKRVEVWYTLRFKYKCAPIQNSLWLIRSIEAKEALEKLRTEWLGQYKAHDFKALIEIFPIKTNDAGYKTFKSLEFEFILEWLGKIEKSLVKARDTGKIGKKNVQAHTKKIELLGNILREDFDDTFPNWKLAQDSIFAVQDLLHQVQSGDNIII